MKATLILAACALPAMETVEVEPSLLARDDECAAEGASAACALNALQRRGHLRVAEEQESTVLLGLVDPSDQQTTKVFARDKCYKYGDKISAKYTCENGIFTQEAYWNGGCEGEASTLGGASPWQFGANTWTCEDSADTCKDSWNTPDATKCVTAATDQTALAQISAEPVLDGRLALASVGWSGTEDSADAGSSSDSGSTKEVYATEKCYNVGSWGLLSAKYLCNDGVFTQETFWGSGCNGEPSKTGGASPWHFALATWTCEVGADACANAKEESGATACVSVAAQPLTLVQEAAAPALNGQLALTAVRGSSEDVYATDFCYPVGSLGILSVKYECKGGNFSQLTYWGSECNGEPSTLGGASPWHFVMATWTCEEGDACSGSYKSAGATECVHVGTGDSKDGSVALGQMSVQLDSEAVDQEMSLVRAGNAPEVYATDKCYNVGSLGLLSAKYLCKDGVFTQETFWGSGCSGEPSQTGGASPWKFALATWTCEEGADACAGAKEVEGATACVSIVAQSFSLAQEEDASDVAPALNGQLALAAVRSSTATVYATDLCYPIGSLGLLSVKFECEGGNFTQLTYWGSECGGEPSPLGGPSPWHFAFATWTCEQGADACAGAYKAEGATTCVNVVTSDTQNLALGQVSAGLDSPAIDDQLALVAQGEDADGSVYATEHCYSVGSLGLLSVKYSCQDGNFMQHTYWGSSCSGEPSDNGGKSPFEFAFATWTCQEGAEACAGAEEVEGATQCVGVQVSGSAAAWENALKQ